MKNNREVFRNSAGSFLLCAVIVALINGCSPPKQSEILVQMIKAQEECLAKETVPGFDRNNGTATSVVDYENASEFENEMEKHHGSVALVKIPFEKAASLISNDRLLPLDDIVPAGEINDIRRTFALASLGAYNGKQFLIPCKFETSIMVFCESKVSDALKVWRSRRDSISADLKAINGYGLPATYILEDDPNKWDFFDVYVLGWIWSHTPYNGEKHGRIAHSGNRYPGTFHEIIDEVFQCRGTAEQAFSMNGEAVTDAFMWEAVYSLSGYNSNMWKDAWSESDIWKGFGNGKVFIAFVKQVDCFFIHGTGSDGLDGFMKDKSDMGVAQMPQGCSVILDKNGNPAREGCRAATTGGWWWGIPKDAPDPKKSYKLARYLTSTKNQISDCGRFGMIPVRKDLLGDISLLFGESWITEVYETSFRQLMNNGSMMLPVNSNNDEIGKLYLDAWYDIVVDKNRSNGGESPEWNYINEILEKKYSPPAVNISGKQVKWK
jgi:hypothetical protein